jgi:ketosteroid isomerase-like protein
VSEVSIHPTSVARFIDRLHEAFLEEDDAAAAKAAEASNVAALTELYRAIARGDFASALARMADDVELELRGPADVPINGHWRGLADVAAAMRGNFAALAEQQAEVHSVVAQGDVVVILARERGKVRASGAPYCMRWVQDFTFRGDKLVRIRGVSAHLPDAGA